MAEKERKQKLSFRSIPTRPVIVNFKKIAKKIQKIIKQPLGFSSSQIKLRKAESRK